MTTKIHGLSSPSSDETPASTESTIQSQRSTGIHTLANYTTSTISQHPSASLQLSLSASEASAIAKFIKEKNEFTALVKKDIEQHPARMRKIQELSDDIDRLAKEAEELSKPSALHQLVSGSWNCAIAFAEWVKKKVTHLFDCLLSCFKH